MQLARVVSRAAKGRQVREVRLRIGALRQVVPETMAYAWNFVANDGADKALSGAKLNIQWVPVVIECDKGHRTELGSDSGFRCPICGEFGRVVSGEEFTVIDIDVASV